jgi:hypothetical protein
MTNFFYNSGDLDVMVLRPLSHIKGNWELTWDNATKLYAIEEGSFAEELNSLIKEIEETLPPTKYHDNEDILVEYVRTNLNWQVSKVNNRWVGNDYESMLEQGGFGDVDEKNLILAAAGRLRTAINLGQLHFDDMEEGHKKMFAAVLSIILYHRS